MTGDSEPSDTAELTRRVENLERNVDSIKETLVRMELRVNETHTFISTFVPTLATKVELADLRVTVSNALAVVPTLATKA